MLTYSRLAGITKQLAEGQPAKDGGGDVQTLHVGSQGEPGKDAGSKQKRAHEEREEEEKCDETEHTSFEYKLFGLAQTLIFRPQDRGLPMLEANRKRSCLFVL